MLQFYMWNRSTTQDACKITWNWCRTVSGCKGCTSKGDMLQKTNRRLRKERRSNDTNVFPPITSQNPLSLMMESFVKSWQKLQRKSLLYENKNECVCAWGPAIVLLHMHVNPRVSVNERYKLCDSLRNSFLEVWGKVCSRCDPGRVCDCLLRFLYVEDWGWGENEMISAHLWNSLMMLLSHMHGHAHKHIHTYNM